MRHTPQMDVPSLMTAAPAPPGEWPLPGARLALICDFLEEGWLSMDLTAEMIFEHVQPHAGPFFQAERIRPKMTRRLAALPFRASLNADRVMARFFDYPRALRRERARFDLFHIVDHSYAQLARELPGERTVITCHDVDALRCLTEKGAGVRGLVLRGMARRILEGLRRAARVVCVSASTRDELVAGGLVEASRTVVIHNGVHPACSPHADLEADAQAARLCGMDREAIPLLHVGSTIPRKRIDVLLQVMAAVRDQRPRVTLLRVGGPLTEAQQALAARLGLQASIRTLPRLSARLLSAVYRRAVLVLQPSEREGFGLPVAEALACGTPVVASDIPSVREVAGDAAVYRPVGDVPGWCGEIVRLIDEYTDESTDEYTDESTGESTANHSRWAGRRSAALAQAAGFSWAAHTRQLISVYRDLL